MGTTNQAGCSISYRLEPSDLDSWKAMDDTITIVQLTGDKGMDQYDRGTGDALADMLKIPKLKEAYSTYLRDMLGESVGGQE